MSTQPTLTILPPAPQEVHYDEHSFERKPHVAGIETRIDWADAPRIHSFRKSDRRSSKWWVPLFANNEKQLRHVLAQVAWQHMHKQRESRVIPPALAEDFVILEQMCIEHDKIAAQKPKGRK